MDNNKKRIKAFTLAEILITIAIIGVVASLTIKSVIVSTQKEQTVVRVKKAYTVLYQALYRAEVRNGSFQNWDFNINASDFFQRYLNGFIVVGKDRVQSNKKRPVQYYELNGDPLNLGIFQDSWAKVEGVGNGYSFTLPDGTKIFLSDTNFYADEEPDHVLFVIDINGDNGPNTMGKDLFCFCLYKTRGLLPFYTSDHETGANTPFKKRELLISGGVDNDERYKYYCEKKARGEWCAALIMVDGWRIKDDYPW